MSATNPAPPVQPPTAVADKATTAENHSVAIDVLANDTDPNDYPLTITALSSAATGGTANHSAQGGALVETPAPTAANPSREVVTYTPPTGYFGPDTFIYTISNGQGGTAVGTVTVTVTPPPPRNCRRCRSSCPN